MSVVLIATWIVVRGPSPQRVAIGDARSRAEAEAGNVPSGAAEIRAHSVHREPEVRAGSGSVAGVVETGSGDAVAGATVHASCGSQTISDAAGRFVLRDLRAGELRLRAEAGGLVGLPIPPLRLRPGETLTDLVLVMQEAGQLEGRVVSGEGRPVVGAEVNARLIERRWTDGLPHAPDEFASTHWTTTSDREGWFRLDALPRGSMAVTVEHPDYLGFGRIRASDGPALEVVLSRCDRIRGRLVDASGRGVDVVQVTLLVSRGGEGGPWSVLARRAGAGSSAGEVGDFAIAVRTTRTVRVVVEGAGQAPVVSPPLRCEARVDLEPLWLRAREGPRVEGRVVNDLGRPVAGAEVVVHEVVGETALVQSGAPYQLAAVITDPAGRFTSAPLADGLHAIAVGARGHAAALSEPFSVSEGRAPGPLELPVVRTGAIDGAIEGTAGMSLPALRVRALAQSDSTEEPTTRWPHPSGSTIAEVRNGAFHFPGLTPGRWNLALLASESPREEQAVVAQEEQVDVSPGGISRVVLGGAVLGHATVTGTLAVNGVPGVMVDVFLRSADRPLVWTCTTDRHGAFRFDAVPRGAYVVTAGSRPAGGELGQVLLEVPARGEVREELRLETTSLGGRIVDGSTGDPIARADVRLTRRFADGRTHPAASATTNADGTFHWPHVPAAAAVLSVRKAFFATREVEVELHPRTPLHVPDLSVTATGSLVVVFGDRERLGSGRLILEAFRPGDVTATVRRELDLPRNGGLEIEELPPGPMEVIVRLLETGTELRSAARVVAGEWRTVVLDLDGTGGDVW